MAIYKEIIEREINAVQYVRGGFNNHVFNCYIDNHDRLHGEVWGIDAKKHHVKEGDWIIEEPTAKGRYFVLTDEEFYKKHYIPKSKSKDASLHDSFINHLNEMIQDYKVRGLDISRITDGYHSFDEIYRHRNLLFATLVTILDSNPHFQCWKSHTTYDGLSNHGWFLTGVIFPNGHQISYHLPIYNWDNIPHSLEREYAPKWDGHKSDDVLIRLEQFIESL